MLCLCSCYVIGTAVLIFGIKCLNKEKKKLKQMSLFLLLSVQMNTSYHILFPLSLIVSNTLSDPIHTNSNTNLCPPSFQERVFYYHNHTHNPGSIAAHQSCVASNLVSEVTRTRCYYCLSRVTVYIFHCILFRLYLSSFLPYAVELKAINDYLLFVLCFTF